MSNKAKTLIILLILLILTGGTFAWKHITDGS